MPDIGTRFGALVVFEHAPAFSNRKRRVHCRCDCGKVYTGVVDAMRRGLVASCGCRQGFRKHGHAANNTSTPEYNSWQAMKDRCDSPACPAYHYYGGRGIRICDEWRHNFEAFLAHVGRRPGAGYTIDRIDNDGHYAPGNVRWATKKEQAANRRLKSHMRGQPIRHPGPQLKKDGTRVKRTPR